MIDKERTRLSKKMSYALRHHPEEFGLVLADGGWVSVIGLAAALSVTPEDIYEVVGAVSDKVRFTIANDFIRAAQGHSIKIELNLPPTVPPPILYHGTHIEILPTLYHEGIRKMERTHVHLSTTSRAAADVGRRRGDPVVVKIDTKNMVRDGYHFYVADNGVWLTDRVPSAYFISALFRDE